jgi:hypothetical protein
MNCVLACSCDNNEQQACIPNQQGRIRVEQRENVARVIGKFFHALDIDDASGIPLNENVLYYGMFSPEPIRGEAEVRDYIQQIAPFMLNEKHGDMIIEDGRVAVTGEFDFVNGLHNEGAFFFNVKEGEICEVRVIFDTRKMFEGKKN